MDYNVLRKVVANCVEGNDHDPDFRLNLFKLNKRTKSLGLIPVVYKNQYNSKHVTPDDIPLLMEYFKEDKIEWFDSKKTYLSIIFLREEDVEDELQELLQNLTASMKPMPDRLPCGVIPAKISEANFVNNTSVAMNKYNCNGCNDNKCIYLEEYDSVNILAQIVGNYPCYTAIVARWIRPETVSLYIRFRANSILLAEETESEEETADDETE